MNILFVTRMLPHPEFRGSGGQDLFHYIESLSQKHEVSLIAFVESENSETISLMQRICKQVIIVPFSPDKLSARLWRAGWRVMFSKVYGRNVSLAYASALRAAATDNHYDAVVIEGTMALYAWLLPKEKRILDEIDIYTRVAYQEYKSTRNVFRRLISWLEWKRTSAIELRAVRRVEGVIVRSKNDCDWLKYKMPANELAIVSPWFEGLSELMTIEPVRPEGNKILFMGALKNPKNRDAVLFFVKQVYPRIKSALPDALFLIVGDAPTRVIRDLGDDSSIIVTGEVRSLKPYYEQCAVNVVPLLIGGGIIVKSLNGMAAGRPTVSTPQGASGIDAQPNKDLLVVSAEPQYFADEVVRVLTDDELWISLAEQGKDYVRRQYNWSDTVDELEGIITRAAGL